MIYLTIRGSLTKKITVYRSVSLTTSPSRVKNTFRGWVGWDVRNKIIIREVVELAFTRCFNIMLNHLTPLILLIVSGQGMISRVQ